VACLRRRWKDGGRGTLADPPLQLLLFEVAPSAAPPAWVMRILGPSRPWVHLCMHDKAINIGNAHMMHDVMMKSQRNIKQGANMGISL